MKKFTLIPILLLFCIEAAAQQEKAISLVELSSDSPLEISSPVTNSEEIGIFEKFELTFNLKGKWNNPFDPDQVKVDAEFRMPDGSSVTIPGFFYQEYNLDPFDKLIKIGNPVWKIRFTPVSIGKYSYKISVINQNMNITSPGGEFECVSYNTSHGFIKVSDNNPLYFDYSDGTPFFGIGMDRIAADRGGVYKRFADSGGNFNRLFLTNGQFDIQELTPDPERPDRGLGKINLENSWNLDKLLDLGEDLGIYHMLTLTNQYNFNRLWDIHTYNKANGGILDSKNEYFTNKEAMQYFEKYLRYVVARWGYSTAVFSWDLWNEWSAMGIDAQIAAPWHKRMAHFIDSLDVFDHIIHTNDGKFNGSDLIHAMPEMEIVSTNTYVIKDISYLASLWTRRMTDSFNKPYILTEYGMGHNFPPGAYGGMDPERRMVHNGLWSPVMNGSAATGMPWEARWLNHKIFYTYIQAVYKIVHDIPFSKREWTPVRISSFEFLNEQPEYYGDVIVEGWPGNFGLDRENTPDIYMIDNNGRVSNQESLTAVLTGNPEEGNNNTSEVTFRMEYPVNGKFIVYVTELRDTIPAPQLTITLDGQETQKVDLHALDAEEYHPIKYNQYYPVTINQGTHTISIANTGGGRIVTSFELKNYLKKSGPDLDVYGIQTEDYILLWLKNQKFTVLHELVEIPLHTQPEGILVLENIPDGTWLAEWVNTINADTIKKELVDSKNKKLSLIVPAVNKSIAIRLNKIR